MVGSLIKPIFRGLGGGSQERLDIEFTAYAADCRLTGHLALRETRLSDMLNKHGEIELTEVVASYLTGSPPVRVPRIMLGRDDLYVVHLAGPRGDAGKRRASQPVALGVKLGRTWSTARFTFRRGPMRSPSSSVTTTWSR